MSGGGPSAGADRDALKRAAAEAAVGLVEDGMVVGLGTGSTAAFAVEALIRRHREGLRFVGIPTSEHTAAQARAGGIPLATFAEHRRIDLTIDGADEVERGTLNLIKGLGGALLREKIVAAASRRLAIVVDGAKLVDRLGEHTPVPVEVVTFGLEATEGALEALGARAVLRMTPGGEPFVTDSGNRIVDCRFPAIADPAALEERIGRIVGVVESGLFTGRADAVFVADAAGVRRLDAARHHRGGPPILVLMGVSGSGKTTIARALQARLGWTFEEGDSLHPESNVAKMHAGIPLTDEDRQPWLEAVAAWIDGQRARGLPGIVTCSALKKSYRRIVIGDRPEVRLVYLRGSRAVIGERLAGRKGHFMPASLLQSQFDALEEPGPDEDPLTVDIDAPADQVAEAIIRQLGASADASSPPSAAVPLIPPMPEKDAERQRLEEADARRQPWRKWGPYVSERQWGTVREDYSADGDAWNYSRTTRRAAAPIAGARTASPGSAMRASTSASTLALWNGRDPILKERMFGLSNREGNHGEDVKELYYYLDAVPTYSYARMLYKYPAGGLSLRRAGAGERAARPPAARSSRSSTPASSTTIAISTSMSNTPRPPPRTS